MAGNSKAGRALRPSAGTAKASVVQTEFEPLGAGDQAVDQIDSLVSALPEQMRDLKSRFREERRRLELRTYDPADEA